MKTVAITDTETQGIDPHEHRCVEIAVVKYSVEHACVIDSFSQLCRADSNEAEHVNHIPAALLKTAFPADDAFARARQMADGCDAILAHNAAFDRRFIPSDTFGAIPWICTFQGITWPKTGDARNLVAIALAHGLGVVDPHRALADCMLIARLLTRCAELGTDVAAMLAQGLRPSAHFQALVSFDRKDLAKDAGFQWDPKRRAWLRTMAIEDATEEKLGFAVKRVPESMDV